MADLVQRIDELIARDELRQAFLLFVEGWNSNPGTRQDLWERGYQIVLTLGDKKLCGLYAEYCKRVLSGPSKEEDVLVKLASMYYICEDYDKSLPIYQHLLTLDLSRLARRNIHYCLAVLYNSTKRFALAKEEMKTAIGMTEESDKGLITPYYDVMGEIEGNLGNIDEAVGWYNLAIRYDPNDTDWPRKCALLLEANGRKEQAAAYWKKILSVSKKEAKATVCDEGRPVWQISGYIKNQTEARRRLEAK